MSSSDDEVYNYRAATISVYEAVPGNMAGSSGWFARWFFPGINPPLEGEANCKRKRTAINAAHAQVDEVYAALSRMNAERMATKCPKIT